MKEIPIIMSTDMVKGILDGTKNLTFRVIKPQPESYYGVWSYIRPSRRGPHVTCTIDWSTMLYPPDELLSYCPYGQVGDRLWVRETWKAHIDSNERYQIIYRAGGYKFGVNEKIFHRFAHYESKWQSPMFMFRYDSRITLERTEPAYVKRTLEITEEEAKLCGFESDAVIVDTPIGKDYTGLFARDRYAMYWDSLNAQRGYRFIDNIWVWGVPFGAMSYRGK